MNLPSLRVRQTLVRELLIFLAFVAITAVVTWPWILQLRNGVSDPGDPYSISYFLWWDYHQTLKDPLNLFHATIFYPYRYSLAFGEYDYGVSLLFFPLFAIGLRPLTIYSVAAFLSFPFTAYGTFRLARTISGSNAVAWIAGIVLAFVPFRFHHLAHLHLIFAGWIPLLFEALILYGRARTWRRACWLGFAFVLNALTCTTWLMLTAIPLALSGVLVVSRNRLWLDRTFWLRAAAALGLGSLLLLPFLVPYLRVAELNGFGRSSVEVLRYSATPINWIAAEERNKLWQGLGATGAQTEMVLFPGLLAPLLALAAFLLGSPTTSGPTVPRGKQRLLILLDATAIISGLIAFLAIGYNGFALRPFGHTIITVSTATRSLLILLLAILARCLIAYPRVLRNILNGERSLRETIESQERSELLSHGFLWFIIGFMGSFGLNFPFHRLLYEFVPGFHGMRVASRWAMIAYVGLALLAGAGALRFASLFNRYGSKQLSRVVLSIIFLALLFELNVAPLKLIRGEVNPDAITLFLKSQKLTGGIVELPAGDRNHLYMLRAADHGHPLVNANDSFISPLAVEVEKLTKSEPVPDRFLDLLEEVPVSYVTVRNSLMPADERAALEPFLARATALGRLKFIKSFENANGQSGNDDLYAVSKTEPQAQSDRSSPKPAFLDQPSNFAGLPTEFQQLGFSLYRLFKVSYGRRPQFEEFTAALQRLRVMQHENASQGITAGFAEDWLNGGEFKSQYDAMSDEQFVENLLRNAGLQEIATERRLLESLKSKTLTRGGVLHAAVENQTLVNQEFNPAFIVMQYFVYLHRNPDEGGYDFWLKHLNESSDYKGINEAFANARERQ